MKRPILSVLPIALGFSICFSPHPQAADQVVSNPAREISIAAAADLKFALEQLAREFEAKNPGSKVTPSYGSSGSFYAMLQSQAPFDLYLSADIQYPQKLIEAGLGADTNVFIYAVGELVIWVPKQSPIDVESLGFKALLAPSIRKIAIANPAHAPYGRAAEAALKSQKLYEQVQPKLVFGENITQTLQYVQSGAADIGLIARSLAQAPQIRGKGRYWEVPQATYPKLEQGGLVLKWARNAEAAHAFRTFMLGEQGRAVLERYGFLPPEK